MVINISLLHVKVVNILHSCYLLFIAVCRSVHKISMSNVGYSNNLFWYLIQSDLCSLYLVFMEMPTTLSMAVVMIHWHVTSIDCGQPKGQRSAQPNQTLNFWLLVFPF